jgi:hypothetical protein
MTSPSSCNEEQKKKDLELGELIRKAEEYLPDKGIPYLGWFWRDFADYRREITLSLCEDKVYIDEANKWDYPSCKTTVEDGEKIREYVSEISRMQIELGEILNSYKPKLLEKSQ